MMASMVETTLGWSVAIMHKPKISKMKNKKEVMKATMMEFKQQVLFEAQNHETIRHLMVDIAKEMNGDDDKMDYDCDGYSEIMEIAWEIMQTPEYKNYFKAIEALSI